MKISVSLFSLLFGVWTVASAQSPSHASGPNPLGATGPNGSINSPAARDNQSASPTGTVPADQKPTAAQPTKVSADEADMKNVPPMLNAAKEKLRSTTSSNARSDALAVAESALETLKKTPGDGRYRGHRVKAIDKLRNAVAELKAGDPTNRAAGYLTETITEVNVCLGLVR